MLHIFAIIFIGSVYLSTVGAEPQNANSRNAQYNPEPMQNTAPIQAPPQYEKPRQEYRDGYQNEVLNIGNGHDRHNHVIINENHRRPINVDGTYRNTGNNQQNVGGTRTDQNGNFSNRFGSENIPPPTNSNPRPVNSTEYKYRSVITIRNIGNGAGNSNRVSILNTPNGRRTDSTISNNNFQIQNNNPNNNAGTTFRREHGNSYIPYITYNRIGHGPNNKNRVVINGKTVYNTELESQMRQGEQSPTRWVPRIKNRIRKRLQHIRKIQSLKGTKNYLRRVLSNSRKILD